MFPISSLKTCNNCYRRLLIPFFRIYADLTLKPTYIWMCAKVQMILEFPLMWIRVTCLLSFHMPWDHSNSTFHYPIEELYKEPFRYIEERGIEKQENYSPLFPELYLSPHPFVPWITLCSSQACLLLVSLLSRDGGLRWWMPKWGTQFLWFADVPTKIVTILISILYQ